MTLRPWTAREGGPVRSALLHGATKMTDATKSDLMKEIERQIEEAVRVRMEAAAERARAKALRERELAAAGVPLNREAWER
jgi:hypothetical protein